MNEIQQIVTTTTKGQPLEVSVKVGYSANSKGASPEVEIKITRTLQANNADFMLQHGLNEQLKKRIDEDIQIALEKVEATFGKLKNLSSAGTTQG